MDKLVNIHGSPERTSAGFLKIDRYKVSHSTYRGAMTPPLVREVMERGDAAAVIAHDVSRDVVVLVEQFRLPAHLRVPGEGWVIEAIAGMVGEGESPEETAARECHEETGLTPRALQHIATVFPSVGGSTERVFLYYGEVDASGVEDGALAGTDEQEDIRVLVVDRAEIINAVRHGGVSDAKLMIGLLWMADRT
ncbi:MAG: NUDIX domain-containing protein [Pseudomonadota bacterium]